MKPYRLIDTAAIPGSDESLRLYEVGDRFVIRLAGSHGELMSTRSHGSEEALADLACAGLATRAEARVLIGGLGMGFTLAAALGRLGVDARVVVAELVPGVVAWNRGPLGSPSGRPLDDVRVEVREADVALVLREEGLTWDAILLDVDNGPSAVTRPSNGWLYELGGLAVCRRSLRVGGVLAVWSAGPDEAFADRLRKAGFGVAEHRVFAHGKRGSRHTLWMATRRTD